MKRLLIIGLEQAELQEVRKHISCATVIYDNIPKIQLINGELFVENPNFYQDYIPVSHVLFYGIFAEDFPLMCALTLWNGQCFPSPRGMMECRQRIPCLLRALQTTKFGKMSRGFASTEAILQLKDSTVAKWGEWHCGENKLKFSGKQQFQQPTLLEPFIEGESVRIVIVGDQYWQIHMDGDGWLKNIHHQNSHFMEVDHYLLEDTRNLQRNFGLDFIGVDYIVGKDGEKYLLEVNHIPSVTCFPEIRTAYLNLVKAWATKQSL